MRYKLRLSSSLRSIFLFIPLVVFSSLLITQDLIYISWNCDHCRIWDHSQSHYSHDQDFIGLSDSMMITKSSRNLSASASVAIGNCNYIFAYAFQFNPPAMHHLQRQTWKNKNMSVTKNNKKYLSSHFLPKQTYGIKSTLYAKIQVKDDKIIENKKKKTGKTILDLAVPTLVALAIDPLMTLADTAFIGRYSPTSALAGVGTASALLLFAFYLFNFLSISTTPLVSTKRASGDVKGSIDIAGQSLSLAIVLGFCLTFVLYFFANDFLGIYMGSIDETSTMDISSASTIFSSTSNKQEAFQYAMSFLTIRAFAAPAVFICNSSVGILRGFLDTRTPLVILLAANVINFSLDCILIPSSSSEFGFGLGMGPSGAAIATTTAEWISALSFLAVLAGYLPSFAGDATDIGRKKRGNESVPIKPSMSIPSWEEIKPLILASSSTFLRSAAIQITLSGAAAMAARGGLSSYFPIANVNNEIKNIYTTDMSVMVSTAARSSVSASGAVTAAAHQIAIQLWLLTSYVCDALAAASQTLIADALGRKDALDVRDISKTVLLYAIFLGITLAFILSAGTYYGDHPFLLSFFTPDPDIQETLIPVLGWIIISQPLNSLVFTADGILQGASEFSYQAKSVVLSAGVAMLAFFGLEIFFSSNGTFVMNESEQSMNITPLIHIWEALVVLIGMRGLTSGIKIVEKDGPINILGTK